MGRKAQQRESRLRLQRPRGDILTTKKGKR